MIVKESLYNFKREQDPIQSSGLGEVSFIEKWLNSAKVLNYKIKLIEGKYIIDANAMLDFYLNDFVKNSIKENNGEFPSYIQFGAIDGTCDFDLLGLKTLRGSPNIVGGDFRCESNKLTSLEYGPSIVNGDYKCSFNKLTTLKGAPNKLYTFDCNNNNLTSLEYGPVYVKHLYNVGMNSKQFTKRDVLKTLTNIPEVIIIK